MKSLQTASVAQCQKDETKLGAQGTEADLGAPFDGRVTRYRHSVGVTNFLKSNIQYIQFSLKPEAIPGLNETRTSDISHTLHIVLPSCYAVYSVGTYEMRRRVFN